MSFISKIFNKTKKYEISRIDEKDDDSFLRKFFNSKKKNKKLAPNFCDDNPNQRFMIRNRNIEFNGIEESLVDGSFTTISAPNNSPPSVAASAAAAARNYDPRFPYPRINAAAAAADSNYENITWLNKTPTTTKANPSTVAANVSFQNIDFENEDKKYKCKYRKYKNHCKILYMNANYLKDKNENLKLQLSELKFDNRTSQYKNYLLETKMDQITAGSKHFISNIESMMNDQSTDITIICGTQTFKVHKFILCAHSPVFYAMLTTAEWNEKKDSIITIKDTTPEAVENMIKYFYSGILVKNISENEIIEVLNLSEKYDLKLLKDFMEKKLEEKLITSNAPYYFYIADLFNCETLKEKCIYIAKNSFDSIKEMKEWKKFEIDHPKIAHEFVAIVSRERFRNNEWVFVPPEEVNENFDFASSNHLNFHRGFKMIDGR